MLLYHIMIECLAPNKSYKEQHYSSLHIRDMTCQSWPRGLFSTFRKLLIYEPIFEQSYLQPEKTKSRLHLAVS